MQLQHVASVSLHMTPVNLSNTVSLSHTQPPSLSLRRPALQLRTSKLRENRPPSKTDVIHVDAAKFLLAERSRILHFESYLKGCCIIKMTSETMERWETISLRSNACRSNEGMQQCPQTHFKQAWSHEPASVLSRNWQHESLPYNLKKLYVSVICTHIYRQWANRNKLFRNPHQCD